MSGRLELELKCLNISHLCKALKNAEEQLDRHGSMVPFDIYFYYTYMLFVFICLFGLMIVSIYCFFFFRTKLRGATLASQEINKDASRCREPPMTELAQVGGVLSD